jgi:lipopolysaccharide biosynthesis glycosyltransferase
MLAAAGGTGAMMADVGIVTKADANFFPGLVSLLGSIACHAPQYEVVVLDCGLLPHQRRRVEALGGRLQEVHLAEFSLERESDRQKYSPAIYAFLTTRLLEHDTTVLLDADIALLGPLDRLIAAAESHGCAAVPDHPPLSLAQQVGSEVPLCEIENRIGALQPSAITFNAGVMAIRADYHEQHLAAVIRALLPYHARFWGNDQAVLNLATFRANPGEPFRDAGREFNARPRYRRDPDVPPLRLKSSESGPVLEGFGGRIHVLHFVGRPKPWEQHYPQSCPSYAVWRYFQSEEGR